jgi:diaminopimelate epimerase
MTIFKYSGAGNDFVVLDGRSGGVDKYREVSAIKDICREYHTDGLMILGPSPVIPGVSGNPDFTMEFYNPDGSSGMMCGNGGRCITAFADSLGIKPTNGKVYIFSAPDGLHTGEILSRDGDGTWTVKLGMIDVHGVAGYPDGLFLNTGTRHFCVFMDDVDSLDVETIAPPLRHDRRFAPEGTNVNFISVRNNGLKVRTFEKGVEGETLACGTGITASAIAAYVRGASPSLRNGASVCYDVFARSGDRLSVDFIPSVNSPSPDIPGSSSVISGLSGDLTFTGVFLTGPACRII